MKELDNTLLEFLFDQKKLSLVSVNVNGVEQQQEVEKAYLLWRVIKACVVRSIRLTMRVGA